MRLYGDERGVILSWFAKVAVVWAVIGVLLFDAGSMVVNYVGLDSTADDIANSLAVDIAANGGEVNPVAVTDAAKVLARDAGARLKQAEVDSEGVLHIRLRRSARTLFASRIEGLRPWAEATATARASTN
jgi:hypothetical protein